ncbi:5-methyltetrahydropteroyltriglutamate--homocysteine S-methyltransferase [Actinomycetospora sp. NBRC 106378]|uniref:5-methyltetrahydropteroyltriglutamate-- homocysteine S-methyltransferase n=1 Tax=Actinomycetospora sp. NBRC 106378 TaxID=3032208 RepID=UPI0024A3B3D8|nr:5-methyltetrahydropteroyltriglutamate--homocysteine S-methyltransferase [Actinomycetospora sp. NBRC 106378]GLZ54548.1 5-methyltetrahydropteroyltriglutamate--homocysteine methyltransferase [Actinomycetospora sp. NBRC 106378]
MSAPIGSTVLGYPRIGPRRELKKALESYWAGTSSAEDLQAVAAEIRAGTRADLAALDSQPTGTFSFYDQVADVTALLDAVPPRFRPDGSRAGTALDEYFAMARGTASAPPMEMTKWFDTNYHYLVPEIGPDTTFRLAGRTPVDLFREAVDAGVRGRPALVGPVSYLLLAKPADGAREGFAPLSRLDDVVAVYAELLGELADAGAEWVQLDESAFVQDRTEVELEGLRRAYERLAALERRPRILTVFSYGDPAGALDVITRTGVEGVALDLVTAPGLVDRVPSTTGLRDTTLVAGVVDGRNVWRADLPRVLSRLATVLGGVGDLAVSSSCSLLHVPYDVSVEDALDDSVAARLAFAREKVAEVALLGRALTADGSDDLRHAVSAETALPRAEVDRAVRDRVREVEAADRTRSAYDVRRKAQADRLGLPDLATTTIGSFPQTPDVRRARADFAAGRLDEADYTVRMQAEIERVVRLQEDLGLDVLVHGEPERNDMVQYFADTLPGFATTRLGWVQSYGSRCVRPPILHGDVSRPQPMTVEWARYAQSLTARPMKGMLTGPVTILAWSFVRDDQPLGETADQVALALRDEIADLEAAGIGIVQVDEAALRELLPPRRSEWGAYLDWAVGSFRLATGGAADETQIHTHLCYSEFGDVIDAIDGLDADVTTIEAARSRMEILADLAEVGYSRGVGPGVYDIHSPRVPTRDEIAELIAEARRAVPDDRLWINPDCGLKTRGYAEVEPTLRAMVDAAVDARSSSGR